MNTILILWVIGAIILAYYSILELYTEEYEMGLALIILALFPVTAILFTAIVLAGLIRYFIFKRPNTFKQFMIDIKNELGGV